MTIRWRIKVGSRRRHSWDAPWRHFIPPAEHQPGQEGRFPGRGAKPQAAQVLCDPEQKVELDDSFAGGDPGHLGPAPISGHLGHPVVEPRFLLEPEQALGVGGSRVLRVSAVGVGHSWEPDHRPAFEQDACKEVQIEDHFPVGSEALGRQPAPAVADGRAHDEVAVHERLDGGLSRQHERPFGRRLEEALDGVHEREARPARGVDHLGPTEKRGRVRVLLPGFPHDLDVVRQQFVVVVEQVDEIGLRNLQATIPVARHAEVALVAQVADPRVADRLDQFAGAGLRAVVADNHSPMGGCLPQDAFDREAQVRVPLVKGDGDGQRVGGRVGHSRTKPVLPSYSPVRTPTDATIGALAVHSRRHVQVLFGGRGLGGPYWLIGALAGSSPRAAVGTPAGTALRNRAGSTAMFTKLGRFRFQRGRRGSGPGLRLEAIEPRIVPNAVDIGTLVGRRFFSENADIADLPEVKHFDLDAAAVLDAQFTPDDPNGSELQLIGTDLFERADPDDGNRLHLSLPSGEFDANVALNAGSPPLSTHYRLALAADRAPGRLVTDSTDVRGDLGRDVGTLSAAAATTVRDFIGYLDTSNRAGRDLVDTYFFDTPVFGTVTLTLDELVADTAGGTVAADLRLFRDIDGDGRLEPDEVLDSRTAGAGQTRSIERQLNAGRYAVVVSSLQSGSNLGGSNYRLRAAYSPPDNAGNLFASARDIGGLGGNIQTFADYLSAVDGTDIYRFSTVGDGPFVFDARLSGVPDGAVFDIELKVDTNGNGQVDLGDEPAIPAEGSTVDNVTYSIAVPGTHYVRLRRIAGEGPYTLSMSNRNLDLAGSTLQPGSFFALPDGLAGYEGLVRVSDFLSATDTADVYGFTTTHPGTIQLSLGATSSGTDANLQLIRDLDGDRVIDADDILAASNTVGNAAESIVRFSAAGAYFVRVSRAAGSPFYNLVVNLDTAGDTVAAARELLLNGGVGRH